MSYILQKLQSEKKVRCYKSRIVLGNACLHVFLCWKLVFLLQKVEKLTAMLHSLHERPSKGHVYYAGDRLAPNTIELQKHIM